MASRSYGFSPIHFREKCDRLTPLIEHTPGSSGGSTKAASFFLPQKPYAFIKARKSSNAENQVARPEGLEPPTPSSGG